MKHILLSLSLAAPAILNAWNVGTAPVQKNALIEEYTGIHCPNCPDGHRVASELISLHPETVFSMAVHAGPFAVSRPGEPHFVTEVGQSLNDYFGVNSYPSGLVNRSEYMADNIIMRSLWGSACREIIRQQAPVSLWAESSYDADSRQLTLEVEGYFQEDMTEPLLNVFLLQSEVLGPQDGGQLGVEYPHRHMLRANLAESDFGDAIETKAQGEFFKRSYSCQLPEQIDGVATDPVNTTLLIFVSEGKGDIAQVIESRPSTDGLEQKFSVSASASLIGISKNYALDYVEVFIHNHGGEDVTSAEFDVTLNGDTETVEWNGLVPAHSSSLVKVDLGEAWNKVIDEDGNQYALRMMKANGKEVETPSVRGSFNAIFSYPARMTAKIKTDLDAGDNTWRIIDSHGETVKEFGPYPAGEAKEYTETIELEPGEVYGLRITDCWGDGVRHPLGYFKLYDEEGELVAQVKEINGYGLQQFFRADAHLGVSAIDGGSAIEERHYYDLTGREVSAPEAGGIYIVRTLRSNGVLTTEKVIE